MGKWQDIAPKHVYGRIVRDTSLQIHELKKGRDKRSTAALSVQQLVRIALRRRTLSSLALLILDLFK